MALQAAFLSYALGGSDHYDGNGNMTSAHQRLVREYNLRMEHFDLVLQHLGASLKELGVPDVSICARIILSLSAPDRLPRMLGTSTSPLLCAR